MVTLTSLSFAWHLCHPWDLWRSWNLCHLSSSCRPSGSLARFPFASLMLSSCPARKLATWEEVDRRCWFDAVNLCKKYSKVICNLLQLYWYLGLYILMVHFYQVGRSKQMCLRLRRRTLWWRTAWAWALARCRCLSFLFLAFVLIFLPLLRLLLTSRPGTSPAPVLFVIFLRCLEQVGSDMINCFLLGLSVPDQVLTCFLSCWDGQVWINYTLLMTTSPSCNVSILMLQLEK